MNVLSEKRKLILGHAGKTHTGAITVDIDPKHEPDVIHDLNQVPYPFLENQFLEIHCHHVLEHLDNLTPVMTELHRICDPHGTLYIEVPHHSSFMANIPEHKLRFNYFGFDNYIENGRSSWLTGKKFKLLKREVTFHRRFRNLGLHKIFNRHPDTYERFWTFMIPSEHMKFWLQPVK